MTNQLPPDWGHPEWGAKPGSTSGRRPRAGSSATGTDERQPAGRQPGERQPVARQPPGPGPGRSQRRQRQLSGVILGLLAVVSVFVVGFILLVMWVVSMARGPIDATNAFVAELDEGRLNDAYASMCSEAKATYSLEDFTSHMTASEAITGYTFASASVRANEQTVVSGTIDVNEIPRAADFGLREEDDAWKVCSYPLVQE